MEEERRADLEEGAEPEREACVEALRVRVSAIQAFYMGDAQFQSLDRRLAVKINRALVEKGPYQNSRPV